MGKNKRRKPPPKKGFFTARRLMILGALAAAAEIFNIGPSIYQTWIADEQARDEALQPDLTMDLRVSTIPQNDEAGTRATFEVSTENRGRKEAAYFYWHLNVPDENITAATYKGGINNAPVQPTKERYTSGVRFFHFQGLNNRPLPQIGMTIGTLVLQIKPNSPPFNITWQITCCDDLTFPVVADPSDRSIPLGSITINPGALKRWNILKTSG